MKLFSVFDHNSKFLSRIVAESVDEAYEAYRANVCSERLGLVSVFFVDDFEINVVLFSEESLEEEQ